MREIVKIASNCRMSVDFIISIDIIISIEFINSIDNFISIFYSWILSSLKFSSLNSYNGPLDILDSRFVPLNVYHTLVIDKDSVSAALSQQIQQVT